MARRPGSKTRALAVTIAGAVLAGALLSPVAAAVSFTQEEREFIRKTARNVANKRKKNVIKWLQPQIDANKAGIANMYTKAETDSRIQELRFAPMPAGAVVRGAIGLDLQVAGGTGDFGVEASLPAAPSPLLDDPQVFVQTGTWMTIDDTQGPVPSHDPDQDARGDADVVCPVPADTGAAGWWDQLDELTAQAGRLCIYILESDHADNLIGFGRGYGVKLLWNRADDDTGVGDPDDAPDDMFVTGVWVYTQ